MGKKRNLKKFTLKPEINKGNLNKKKNNENVYVQDGTKITKGFQYLKPILYFCFQFIIHHHLQEINMR